jgi:hypothetical protein
MRVVSQHNRGLYETLITERLDAELNALEAKLHVDRIVPEREEIADRVALHVSSLVERELRGVQAKDRVAVSIRVARALIQTLGAELCFPSTCSMWRRANGDHMAPPARPVR